MSGLPDPLPALLHNVAIAMKSGVQDHTDRSFGSREYYDMLADVPDQVRDSLVRDVERLTGGRRTVRLPAASLHVGAPPNTMYMFVVCAATRPPGEPVSMLEDGDFVYALVVRTGVTYEVTLKREF